MTTKTPDNVKKAVRKYNRENLKMYTLRLNKNTDQDLIEFMETVENKNALMKKLLRNEIKERKESQIE